jgi:hypothetical protein
MTATYGRPPTMTTHWPFSSGAIDGWELRSRPGGCCWYDVGVIHQEHPRDLVRRRCTNRPNLGTGGTARSDVEVLMRFSDCFVDDSKTGIGFGGIRIRRSSQQELASAVLGYVLQSYVGVST